jgi:tetratricopeptide (TPR) repeat protein
MSKLLRTLAAAIVIAATALALHASVWIPYRQGIVKREIAGQLTMIYQRSGGSQPAYHDTIAVRERIAWLVRALRWSPADPVLHIQLAGAYTMLGRYDDAIEQCRVALRHHQRPEIYQAMGDAQFAAGKADEAFTSYAHVAAFYPPQFADVPEAAQEPVRQRVRELYGERAAAMLPVPK